MIKTTKPDNVCPTCNSTVIGRKKKRFCSVKCKNDHHKVSRLQTDTIQKIRNKNTKRAYVVLEGIFGNKNKRIIIHQNTLFKFGFDVNAFLKKQTKNGQQYFSILDYTYRFIGKGLIEVVRCKSTKMYYKEFLDRWRLEFPEGLYIKYGVGEGGLLHFFIQIQDSHEKFLTVIPFKNKAFRKKLFQTST